MLAALKHHLGRSEYRLGSEHFRNAPRQPHFHTTIRHRFDGQERIGRTAPAQTCDGVHQTLLDGHGPTDCVEQDLRQAAVLFRRTWS